MTPEPPKSFFSSFPRQGEGMRTLTVRDAAHFFPPLPSRHPCDLAHNRGDERPFSPPATAHRSNVGQLKPNFRPLPAPPPHPTISLLSQARFFPSTKLDRHYSTSYKKTRLHGFSHFTRIFTLVVLLDPRNKSLCPSSPSSRLELRNYPNVPGFSPPFFFLTSKDCPVGYLLSLSPIWIRPP